MKRSLIAFSLSVLAIAFPQALRSKEAPTEHVIMMPPFLVEVESREEGSRWLFGECPGLEILSAGEEDQTKAFIQDLRLHRNYLSRFIPEEFLQAATVPTTLILFPRSLTEKMDAEMIRELDKIYASSSERSRFEPMSDLRLSDPDSTFIFVILKDWQWRINSAQGRRSSQIVLTPDYLRALVESRAPALPQWYSVGIANLYASSRFSGLQSGSQIQALFETAPTSSRKGPSDDFDAAAWLSEDAARILRADAGAPRPLLPMRELFVPTIPQGRSETYRHVWEAQSELFVRWAYSDRIEGGRDRLRNFVAAAATQPITQELFRSCFGMNYADARDALSDYLPHAVREPLKVPCAPLTAPKPLEFREADPEEIHRIKGEWARRSLRIIRENYPDALPLYVEKTRKFLQNNYSRRERGQKFLATLALFRIDMGDTKGAREIFEEHPSASTARPIAGLKLAQLHLLDALQKPEGPDKNLSEEQASKILAGVSAVQQTALPLEGSYLLTARVLKHLARDPTDKERAYLNEGARLFPRNSQLAIDCVAWNLRAGDALGARTLLEFSLWQSTDPSAREKLLRLDSLARKASGFSD